jgi:hypothetical protein
VLPVFIDDHDIDLNELDARAKSWLLGWQGGRAEDEGQRDSDRYGHQTCTMATKLTKIAKPHRSSFVIIVSFALIVMDFV